MPKSKLTAFQKLRKLWPQVLRQSKKHREQVLRGVIQGKTNKAIAAELGVSVSTVARHVGRLLSEFNCSCREHLASVALAKGYTALLITEANLRRRKR